MVILMSDGVRGLTVRPRHVSGVKEMKPHVEIGPLCRVHIGDRGAAYVVRGTFDEVTTAIFGFGDASDAQPEVS